MNIGITERGVLVLLKEKGWIKLKRITSEELLELEFGRTIRIVWAESSAHSGLELQGVIFNDKIGYEDGSSESVSSTVSCMNRDMCVVYLYD